MPVAARGRNLLIAVDGRDAERDLVIRAAERQRAAAQRRRGGLAVATTAQAPGDAPALGRLVPQLDPPGRGFRPAVGEIEPARRQGEARRQPLAELFRPRAVEVAAGAAGERRGGETDGAGGAGQPDLPLAGARRQVERDARLVAPAELGLELHRVLAGAALEAERDDARHLRVAVGQPQHRRHDPQSVAAIDTVRQAEDAVAFARQQEVVPRGRGSDAGMQRERPLAQMHAAHDDAVERQRRGFDILVEQHQRASRRPELEARGRQRGQAVGAVARALVDAVEPQVCRVLALAERHRQAGAEAAARRVVTSLDEAGTGRARAFVGHHVGRRRLDPHRERLNRARHDDGHQRLAGAAPDQHQLAADRGRLDDVRVDRERGRRPGKFPRHGLARGQAHRVACRPDG